MSLLDLDFFEGRDLVDLHLKTRLAIVERRQRDALPEHLPELWRQKRLRLRLPTGQKPTCIIWRASTGRPIYYLFWRRRFVSATTWPKLYRKAIFDPWRSIDHKPIIAARLKHSSVGDRFNENENLENPGKVSRENIRGRLFYRPR